MIAASSEVEAFTAISIELASLMIAQDNSPPPPGELLSVADLMEDACMHAGFITTDLKLYKRIAEAGEALYRVQRRYQKVSPGEVIFTKVKA